MAHGSLLLTIVEAKDIKKHKIIGKPNAYVTMRIDQNIQRTSTIKQHTDPTWNEKFKFDIIDGRNSVFIEMYDDTIGTDSLLGVGTLDLGQTFQTGMFDGWIPLQRHQTGQPAPVVYGQPMMQPGIVYTQPSTVIVQQPPPNRGPIVEFFY
eukprot:jgi/Hompol1/3704/HPOL_000839-RA